MREQEELLDGIKKVEKQKEEYLEKGLETLRSILSKPK